MSDITVVELGRQPFQQVWELQRQLQQQLIAEAIGEHLLLCEHEPVITLGTSAKPHNILVDEQLLRQKGISLFKVERGGDVTYHGPGQIVAYPILNLNSRKRDIGWYLRELEDCVIKTLADFDIPAHGICGKTGVWINEKKKICSIGVRISRWRTMHGLALNVSEECLAGFSLINPCGFTDIEVSCMQKEAPHQAISVQGVAQIFLRHFKQAF